MPEAKGRKETNNPRPRPRGKPAGAYDDDLPGDDAAAERPAPAAAQAVEPARAPADGDEEFTGFDEEVNNRYEEIKRSGTHISALQQMTIPQLLKVAKDEGISEYTG
jgi:transcription termination factor Rho